MRTTPYMRTILLSLALLSLPGSLLRARELTLLGLADLRGPDTFRSIRRTSEGAHSDVTRLGLRAGNEVDASGSATAEVRAIFRPTVFFQNVGFKRYTVRSVGMLVGGGQGTIERITQQWGQTTAPGDIFALPTTSVAASDLTTMFQEVLDRRGDGSSIPGFMIKSGVPLGNQGPFHVRFSIDVEDAVPWTITGRVFFVGQPAGFPQKRVVEFVSSRRGRAQMDVNAVTQLTDFPTAAGHRYRLDIPTGSVVTGTNAIVITVTDPEDGTSQAATISFTS